MGRPGILIPLPIATDDHQAANTREMVKAGGARMIRQPSVTVGEVSGLEDKDNRERIAQSDALQKLSKDISLQIQAMAKAPQSLANAAHAAWNCGRPNAAKDLADLVESFGGADMMDVIRVGETAKDIAAERAASTSHATRGIGSDGK